MSIKNLYSENLKEFININCNELEAVTFSVENLDVTTLNATTINADTGNITTINATDTNSTNLAGNLTGNVTGDVTGNVNGDVTGNVMGNLTGNVTGDLTGDVLGNLTGDVMGNLTGDVNSTNVTTDNLFMDNMFTTQNFSVSRTIGLASSSGIARFTNVNITITPNQTEIVTCNFTGVTPLSIILVSPYAFDFGANQQPSKMTPIINTIGTNTFTVAMRNSFGNNFTSGSEFGFIYVIVF